MLKEIYKSKENIKGYFCAEFLLKESRTLYQFKVRKKSSGEFFAVVPENSIALETLEKNNELSMKYYFWNMSEPAEICKTRIKSVDKISGSQNYYTIGLEIGFENIDGQNLFRVKG